MSSPGSELASTSASLIVDGGCASVLLASGKTWAESCEAERRRILVIKGEFVDGGERALLRFPSGAQVAGASPSGVVRVSQSGGWVVVESDIPRFSLLVDQRGFESLTCEYKAILVECEPIGGST